MNTDDEITTEMLIDTLNPNENNTPSKNKHHVDTKLYYIENKDIFNSNNFLINGRFWNYIEVLTEKLDKRRFYGYFNKTISMYPLFKLGNFEEATDYFRRCQLFAILEQMAFITGILPEFSNVQSIIKIGPSKNNKKNCCLIDDSTVLDETDNTIRSTTGDINEPHRGYQMFNDLPNDKRNSVINTFHITFIQLEGILKKIKNRRYLLFDPIEILQRIIKFCEHNKLFNLINLLASEIDDKSFLLKSDDQIKLFHDYENLKKLWDSDFITNNHGKFRIFILSIHFIDLIYKNQLNEIF